MTSQPSETRTVRNIYGVLRTVRSHGTYNYRRLGLGRQTPCTSTSRELQTSRRGLFSAGEANVSVSSWSRGAGSFLKLVEPNGQGVWERNSRSGVQMYPRSVYFDEILLCFGDACWQTLGQIWILCINLLSFLLSFAANWISLI